MIKSEEQLILRQLFNYYYGINIKKPSGEGFAVIIYRIDDYFLAFRLATGLGAATGTDSS
nr:hypothetical protein SUGSMm_19160 [Morganella morganii subsp. sibonii]